MVFCRQKPKHCFVACCAALLGKSEFADQEEIVARFPEELRGVEEGDGVPTSAEAISRILAGLELSFTPPALYEHIEGNYEPVIDLLQRNPRRLQEMIVILRHPTNHAILVQRALPMGLVVMDPAATDFSYMSWEILKTRKPEVLFLKRSRNQ